MKLGSVDSILDFAIQKEQDAADFYTDLAAQMDRHNIKEVFLGFAGEERGHKAKLIAVKKGRQMQASEKRVSDLKIGDNLVEIELTSDLGYQEALILAMKAAK